MTNMKFEIVMSGSLVLSALGGVWKASELSSQITSNQIATAKIEQQLEQHLTDAVDRLARIETKLDLLVEEKKQ